MRRTPLNPISKKKCRQYNLNCENLCSQCKNPMIVHEYKNRKPINPISKKRKGEIESEKLIREQLYKRANGHCEWCGKPESQCLGGLHPHELVYRSKGGKLSMVNSVIICNFCHATKGHNLRVIRH